MEMRYESFGGIVSLKNPDCLVFIDKNFMRELGYQESDLWEKERNYLSGPIEVHFSLTNQCKMMCPDCYVSSGSKLKEEMDIETLKRVVDKLKDIGVFHVAFGGGEPTMSPYLIEIAEYCRKKGIVPNITTNGMFIDEKIAEKFRVFEQIHVSLDGLENYYKENKSEKNFEDIDRGIKLLIKYNKKVGLNVVVNKKNFEDIGKIAEYAEKLKLEGILLLRYKPSGRAVNNYEERKLDYSRVIRFYDLLIRLHKNSKIKIYIDCSFIPFLSSHDIPLKSLEFFSVMGCDGGNMLIGINPQGKMNACSFARGFGGNIIDFEEEWENNLHFKRFRDWIKNAKEPCKSCKYLNICKGGCHVVSEFVKNNFNEPDPECPRVVSYNRFRI